MASPSPSSSSSYSCSLKRKRPPMIEIPTVLREIPLNRLRESTPRSDAVSFSGNGVAVSSAKGKKKFIEDTYKIVANSGFFGVYDGHGGRKAAEFAAENLHNNIFEMMKNSLEKEEAVKSGYSKTDRDFLNLGVGSGACCVTALIEGQEIVISNLGDCRAVLSRDGVAEALTKDHRVEEEEERNRIEDKGGYVEIHRGRWRVHGVLSVSRSIGDAHLKDWVVAEPDTKILTLTPDMEFLVLASDGLWEEVSNQEAVDVVRRLLCLADKKAGEKILHKGIDHEKGHVHISPSSSKLRRISLVKQKSRGLSQSPGHNRIINNNNANNNNSSWKDNEDENVSCENESPASKSRRISLVKRLDIKTDSLSEENIGGGNDGKRIASTGGGCLVGACKELVDLALNRGSFDDITVMIIDLKHVRTNSQSA